MPFTLTSHVNVYRIHARGVHFDDDFIRVVYDGHHHVLRKPKHVVLPVSIYHPSGHDRAPRGGGTDLPSGKLLCGWASPEASRSTGLSPKGTRLQKAHREPVEGVARPN